MSKVDARHRETNRTGSESNSVGVVHDIETLILSSYRKCLRVTYLSGGFQSRWISSKYPLGMTVKRSLNLLCGSKYFLCWREGKKVEVENGTVKLHPSLTTSDLIPLQQEVLYQQIAVLGAQLKLFAKRKL